MDNLDTPDVSARGIARSFAAQIKAGTHKPGDQLPTVRKLAIELGVSPATVSSAWQLLGAEGLVLTDRRRGTHVVERRDATGRLRLGRTQAANGLRIDLSRGIPDPGLLPDLGPALQRASRKAQVASYLDDAVDPTLRSALAARLDPEPQHVTVVNGSMDAIDRLVIELASFGDRVAVEAITFPPVLDSVMLAGAFAVSVEIDGHGMTTESLSDAIAAGVTIVIIQPRAHNPTGCHVTQQRIDDLANLLEPTDIIVIENDHSIDLSSHPTRSMALHRPDHTIRILGFSKAYGPDLRLAAIAGPESVIGRLDARRTVGPGWSSRILQQVLAQLVTDPATQAVVELARDTYRQRQQRFRDALRHRGINVAQADGLNAWVPVVDELTAVSFLAAHGVGASPGSPYCHDRQPPGIRITAGLLADNVDEVADLIAQSAAPRAVSRGA